MVAKRGIYSLILLLAFFIVVIGLGYGGYVSAFYVFTKKQTKAEVIDINYNLKNINFIKAKYFNIYDDKYIINDIEIKTLGFEHIAKNEFVDIEYTRIGKVYLIGQKHPSVVGLGIQIVLFFLILYLFFELLVMKNWNVLKLIE
jgi:hypothetical protein